MHTVYSVCIPRFGLFYRTEEHLVHTESIGTIFIDNHIRVDHVEHGFTHLLYSPSADVLAIFQNELGGFIFRTPGFESFEVQDVIGYNIHIHVEWGSVVPVFQIQGHECIGIFDAVYEVAPALNHTLVHQFLERFFGYRDTEVVQEFVPETRVYQVAGGMFGTAYVKVYIVPVFIRFLVYECLVVVWVHISQVIGA